VLAFERLREQGAIQRMPITDYVAATSVGVIDGVPMLDSRLRGRFRAEVGHERRQDSDGRFNRVAGHGRDQALRSGRPRCADLPWQTAGSGCLIAKQRDVVGAI
jgi:ribonuclease PH